MPYFGAVVKEQNGEQEYCHDLIIKAKNLGEALAKADSKASNWYEDNEVVCKVDRVYRTTKKEWCARIFEQSLLEEEECPAIPFR